jgi:hypothetical protein
MLSAAAEILAGPPAAVDPGLSTSVGTEKYAKLAITARKV